MQSNFGYLMSKCPWWLKKNSNVSSFYKAISKLFDEVDRVYNLIEKQHLVDYANGEFLDDLGEKFDVSRNGQTDDRYRNRIKLAMRKYKLIPNLETISNIGEMFTGLTPAIELNKNNEPAQYDVKFISNKDYDYSLIDELDLNDIVGGGVKVNTHKCLDNYVVRTRFGSKTLGQSVIKNEVKRNPVCNFAYSRFGRFGRNRLGQLDLGEENIIDLK
jgi:conserved domain protein